MHINQEFDTEEPNPWSWAVWVSIKKILLILNFHFLYFYLYLSFQTRIQREKNVLKQLISVSHPCLQPAIKSSQEIQANGHGHSHSHGHSHDHSHDHVHSHGSQTSLHLTKEEVSGSQIQLSNGVTNSNYSNSNCFII